MQHVLDRRRWLTMSWQRSISDPSEVSMLFISAAHAVHRLYVQAQAVDAAHELAEL